jgi:hypothetical protein
VRTKSHFPRKVLPRIEFSLLISLPLANWVRVCLKDLSSGKRGSTVDGEVQKYDIGLKMRNTLKPTGQALGLMVYSLQKETEAWKR